MAAVDVSTEKQKICIRFIISTIKSYNVDKTRPSGMHALLDMPALKDVVATKKYFSDHNRARNQ